MSGVRWNVVADHLGERRAEDRDRRREHEPRHVPVADRADRLEQQADAVQVDAVALLEVGLRIARRDGGEMEDDVGPARDELVGHARLRDVGDAASRPRTSRPAAPRAPTMSASVSSATGVTPIAPSRARRSASLRPSMPAPPVMRIRMTRNDRRYRERAAGGSNASSQSTKPARNVSAASTASVDIETGDGASVGSHLGRAGEERRDGRGDEGRLPGDVPADEPQQRDGEEHVQGDREHPRDRRPPRQADRSDRHPERDQEGADLARQGGGRPHRTSIRPKPQISYIRL